MVHKGRVVIGYAHAGKVETPFMESLLQFQKFDMRNDNIVEGYCGVGGHFTTVNRNAVVEVFLKRESKPEWLLFLDTDIVFSDPALLYGLYESADAKERPIVSGVYFTYIDTIFTVAWLQRRSADLGEYRSFNQVDPGLQQVDGIGMGCAIIHRSVLEKMAEAYPRDKDSWVWFGHDLVNTAHGPDRLGEDLTFSRRAKELGFTIWGDGRLTFGHVKSREENVVTVMERFNASSFVEMGRQTEAKQQEALLEAWREYATESPKIRSFEDYEVVLERVSAPEANGAVLVP